jgi:hypothetical protein
MPCADECIISLLRFQFVPNTVYDPSLGDDGQDSKETNPGILKNMRIYA